MNTTVKRDERFRVTDLENPVQAYYVILVYTVPGNKLVKVSVRDKDSVGPQMRKWAKDYGVEFEFSGFINAKYAYDYKHEVQSKEMHLSVTDRERGQWYKD